MAAAKKRGKHLGRPHLAKAKAEKIRKLRESGLSFRKVADQVNVSVGTAVAYCRCLSSRLSSINHSITFPNPPPLLMSCIPGQQFMVFLCTPRIGFI